MFLRASFIPTINTTILFHFTTATPNTPPPLTGSVFSCGDNQYPPPPLTSKPPFRIKSPRSLRYGQCGVYSADIYVTTFLHVTAIEGLQRTKTLVCGGDWTAGCIACVV